jgi:TPR repeat protein
MAVRYSSGNGVAKDSAASLKMLTAAAEAATRPSQMTLATMYASGIGVPPDPAQAARWFRTAYESGEPRRRCRTRRCSRRQRRRE